MNKKQAGIIVTLLVLIVCVGMVATRVNNPLISKQSGKTKEKSAISFSNTDKKSNNANYFVEAKMIKEEQTSKLLLNLKSIMDDENVDKEQKAKVIEEYNNISTNSDKENKVELALKGKGYEEAVCTIENNSKVRVVVKSNKELSNKQMKEIQDVVLSITQLNNVEIEKKE